MAAKCDLAGKVSSFNLTCAPELLSSPANVFANGRACIEIRSFTGNVIGMLKIGIGSKTSTGGAVIEGNQGLMFDGLVASSVGHKATCPVCKEGIGEIVAVGNRTINLPAGPAARAGDYVACGCPPGANTLMGEGTITLGSTGARA